MFSNALKFIATGGKSLLIKIALAALLFTAGTSLGVYGTVKYQHGQQAKKALVAVEKKVELKDTNQATADNVGVKAEEKAEQVRVVYKTITKEVVKYRDKPEAKEKIGEDWVCIHDYAARAEKIPEGACTQNEVKK